jgi:hemoglobin-like flavoprotein
MSETPNPDSTAAARASFDRCCASEDFLPSFYRIFFAKCPEVRPKFDSTDFERQHRLLQHALGMLLLYPSRMETEPWVLKRVADRHAAHDLDIDPGLYPCFVDSLIEAVEGHDPAYTVETGEAWRDAVAPGIAYMQSRYGKGESSAGTTH